ncbi:hypothetical protein HU200_016893 [Digitaria exilis]|uniref:Disease resistance protein At4g27190-like leucine-rich repeats domain-containing protein n=1 Tax=Digitaria exilis TaxID=1010633 RepID=A0A835F7X2_9POAL|nr:hypothetical protein HU200_016893 [Digitaria exilis]
MQRTIAEKLELPTPVMDMLDAQDEEDDYSGMGKGSRAEIPHVSEAIYQHIQKLVMNRRFLVIFHNGSSEEIDLNTFGFHLSGYSRNKVLWSFQGRFRLYPRTKVDRALMSTRTTTDVVLSASIEDRWRLPAILSSDAEEVADGSNIIDSFCGLWEEASHHRQAQYCFEYIMKLCRMGSHLVDYELTTHGSNYWKCDGIMQLKQEDVDTDDDDGADRLWLYGDALYHELRLDVDYYQNPYLSSLDPVVQCLPKIAYWSSPTYGSIVIHDDPDFDPFRKDMFNFKQFDNLRVLKLSACMFSFTSPPFLCCHSLRFLWLDNCYDIDLFRKEEGEVKDDEGIHRCFKRLWVLDVRYSSPSFLSGKIMGFLTQLRELYVMRQQIEMGKLQECLHNIRKLRVTKCYADTSHSDRGLMFSGKDKMELLDFSEFHPSNIERFFVESSCRSLETVIVDGSSTLKEISLKGCAKLKSLLLSGLFPQLYSLDLSGTSVKTLDFSAVTAPELDELYLLDSEKLCAILWPPPTEERMKRYLGKLQIDTRQKEATETRSRSPAEFGWYICVRDARFLGSLEPIKNYFGHNDMHVDISTMASPTHSHGDADSSKDVRMKMVGNLQQVKDDAVYGDVAATLKAIMCQCPPAPCVSSQGCYMHIEDQMRSTKLQTASHHMTLPGFIYHDAKTLHVHDSLFITPIPMGPYDSRWSQLEWCRVERCPKLEGVFAFGSSSGIDDFRKLKTMWVSHLLDARYILAYSVRSDNTGAFKNLTLLHIYCCPRLTHAVTLGTKTSLESLKALEIMWCGDVLEIFSFGAYSSNDNDEIGVWSFPSLKRIDLQELPKLHGICLSEWKIHAPMLKAVRIRGCWSLRTLPIVSGNNMVVCDCEKEWWDKLQWDSKAQRSYYKPIHSRYYKKKMLRGSPLRCSLLPTMHVTSIYRCVASYWSSNTSILHPDPYSFSFGFFPMCHVIDTQGAPHFNI